MGWDEFEVQLNFTFMKYTRSKERDVYLNNTKLCILTKHVNAGFLSYTKPSIMTHMTSIPTNMTYIQALATFRQAINRKKLPHMIRTTGCINETTNVVV